MNDPKSQSEYIAQRNKFGKSLTRLFPDRLPNNMLGFGFYSPYKGMPGELTLMTKYFSEKEYLEVKTEYLSKSKHHEISSDKCLFLINNYEQVNQKNCEGFYPVATEAIFEMALDFKSKKRITDSEVIFIELESGRFLKDNDKHSRYNLPENWTHGYSTGVTTNDDNKTIQIWLVVW